MATKQQFLLGLILSLVISLQLWSVLAGEASVVVINEIAFKGTNASTSDEWIELYNTTNQEQDLSGWAFHLNEDVFPLTGTVPPYGFALLERSNDQTISDIDAHLIFTGALADSGAVFKLTDPSGAVVDQVSDYYAQPNVRSSIERINPLVNGDISFNWAVHDLSTVNAEDAIGGVVLGTPGAFNSATQLQFGMGYEGIKPKGTPSTPPIIMAEQRDHRVAISWEAVPGALFYELTVDGVLHQTNQTEFEALPLAASTISFQLVARDDFLQSSEPVIGAIDYQVPLSIAPSEVLINELDSLPASGPEWVELYNTSSDWKDLNACRLDDAASTVHSYASTDAIAPGGYLSVDLSSAKLNDAGDTLSLICTASSSDLSIDSMFYGNDSPSDFFFSEFGYSIADGYLPDPNDLNTLGRSPDGAESWYLIPLESFPSKGSANPDLTPVTGVVFPEFILSEDQIRITWSYPEGSNIAGVDIELGLESEGFDYQLVQSVDAVESSLLIPSPPRELLDFRLVAFNQAGLRAFGQEVTNVLVNNLGLVISEVLPYPKSGLEFIELHNATDDIIDLTDFELNVANASNDINDPSGSFIFFDFLLFPGEYFALELDPEFYGFRLSNLRSQIIIFDDFGTPVANLDYISPSRGVSVAYDGQLQSTLFHPTPNEENIFRNEAPTAKISVQGAGKTTGCSTLSFNPTGALSSDPDEDDLRYSWFYFDSNQAVIRTEEVENPLTFKLTEDLGLDFKLTLTVRDPFGAESSDEVLIELGHCGGKRRSTASSSSSEPELLDNRLLILNEIYPNPPGSDSGVEFIELYNPHDTDVQLAGWKIGSTSFKGLRGAVPAQGYLQLSNITVRNTGSTLQLLNPAGDIVDEVSYPNAKEGRSWSRNEGGDYLWSVPTPAAVNDFPFEKELIYRQLTAPIIIHSLLPNPDGKDTDREWVRLFNRAADDMDISGWQLRTSSKTYTIADRKLRKGLTYRLFSKTSKLALTNSSGFVQLYDSSGQLVDEVKWTQSVADDVILTRDELITAELPEPDLARVTSVVDGDTIQVEINGIPETVRLLGVDTPETVHPFKPVEKWGKAASDFSKTQLLNQEVRLEYDLTKRGKYGRLLAYVYIGDQHFNAELIRQGYAFAYLSYPFQFREEFRQLELEAQRLQLGLWSDDEIEQVQQQVQQSLEEDEQSDEFEVLEEELEELEEKEGEEEEEGEEEKESEEEGVEAEYEAPIPQPEWDYLELSEVFANPKGADKGAEYVEFINTGQQTINLEGWQLLNSKGKAVLSFSEASLLSSGEIQLFTDLKRSIKNSSEELLLVDPSGKTRDRLSYQQSVKDNQSWVRHPLTRSWQLLSSASPGERNPISFISTDIDSDRDGIPDTDEHLFGMDPNLWDSDDDGLPDDFELVRDAGDPQLSYQQYLTQSLRFQTHQTKRTMKVFGQSRPYTVVQLTFYSTPKQVQIPVNPDGSWEYKVDIGLESGNHHLEVIAIDPLQRQSSELPKLAFSLENRLNASKLPRLRKRKTRKSSAPKPLLVVADFPRIQISDQVQLWDPSRQTLLLSQASALKLPYAHKALASRLFAQHNKVTLAQEYRSLQVEKLQVSSPAASTSSSQSRSSREPIFIFALLFMAFIASLLFEKRTTASSS